MDELTPEQQAERRAKTHAYYMANRERMIKRAEEWQKAHPEQAREIRKRFGERHRDELNKRAREWREKHATPGWEKARYAKRKAMLLADPERMERERERNRKWQRDRRAAMTEEERQAERERMREYMRKYAAKRREAAARGKDKDHVG